MLHFELAESFPGGEHEERFEVWGDYSWIPYPPLVQRRIHELDAAQLQMQIREAALRGDWMQVEQLLAQLETLGRHEPWVAASIAFIRHLMRDRDEQRSGAYVGFLDGHPAGYINNYKTI
jgi:hypothetical protein